MSIEVSLTPTSAPSRATNVVQRRSAGFHPSVWGDHFLADDSGSRINTERAKNHMEKLKMKVKMMLTNADDDKENLLRLIDQIQRLGIGYLFEREIDDSLEQIFNWYSTAWDCRDSSHDLHITALVFRLLRQQGYRISCNVFNRFMADSEGKFSQSLAKDVRGLLSLYEASHFRVHGEDTLEEALTFTVHHLKLAVKYDDPKLNPRSNLVAEVKHALEQCLRKGLVRLHAWRYIQIYEEDASHSEVLLELAKLDFNRLQELHRKELREITRWWKDRLDVQRNFPYARDRITELYFWVLGVYFEPEFSLARTMLTKVIALTSILDDTYDVYGTLEELQLLTNAIDRWDMSIIGELPQYMQIYYKGLLDTYSEFEEKLTEEGISYRLFYAKEAMKNQAKAYLKEEKWFHQKYVPALEEYMSLALETCGYGLLTTTSFIEMGDVASKNAFEWLNHDPKILRSSKIICRLMDDIVSRKWEQKIRQAVSAVECYMKDHGITEEEAENEMWKMIDDAWKDINEECLRPTPVPMPLLTRILNLARVIDLLYSGKDQYTPLAKIQSPKFMVVACADSRVCPSNILGFEPGEALTVRNVANLVPQSEFGPSETSAALEFAVKSLEVKNILVIGHSNCAGIEALMSMDDTESRSYTDKWIVNGKAAKLRTKSSAAHLDFYQQCKHCEKESVNESLKNLLTYPWIEERVGKEELALHGGYYDFIHCTFNKWTLHLEGQTLGEGHRLSVRDHTFWG